MNVQQLFGQSARGNKTNPEDERQAISKAVFGQKKNLAVQVLEASEKNLGINSSHAMDSCADSDSSSDYEDFVYEEIDTENSEPLVILSQPMAGIKLTIKSKNPDHVDDCPKIELVTTRKAIQQTVFLTKVKIAQPLPQKEEESMKAEQPSAMEQKPGKELNIVSKAHGPQNQLLCETSPAEMMPMQPMNPQKAGMQMQYAQEDEVLQLY